MKFSELQVLMSRQLQTLRESLSKASPLREDAATEVEVQELAAASAPVVWLIGKVQSGKTSIVHALTGASTAEIGEGFKACTKASRIYDFPEEAPVLRFLDTRGLGETLYDPTSDIALCEAQSHLVVAVMKALDQDQEAVLDVLWRVRQTHPSWPIVAVQTSLHEAYGAGQVGHVLPYPFGDADWATKGVPNELARALSHQRSLFEGLPGRGAVKFVAIDFVKPEDGFEPQAYGLDALLHALEATAPEAMKAALAAAFSATKGDRAAKADPHILGHAAAAAAADAFPAAGAVAVPVIQASLLRTLGEIYGVGFDRQAMLEFGAQLGASTLSRLLASFGIRQLVKFIPVYGQTAGAAAAALTSFTTTYALGKAACYFLARKEAGASKVDGVAQVYAAALSQALQIFKQTRQAA